MYWSGPPLALAETLTIFVFEFDWLYFFLPADGIIAQLYCLIRLPIYHLI